MGSFFSFLNEKLIQSGAILSILQGLAITLRISALSLVAGTLLAVPLCALRMSGRRSLRVPAQVYIAFVRGTPVLMLLMLFYYVIFESQRIDAALVASIAFSLNVSANVAEIMRGALKSVPAGQLDAAHALGMGWFAVFFHITLPQASMVALPVYQSAVVNLIQWTSVVGYITITDLTRAINFMSTRTMQPLMMLFVGIALYLLMAYAVYGLFGLLARHKFGMSHRHERRLGA